MSDRTHGPTRAMADSLPARYRIIQLLFKNNNNFKHNSPSVQSPNPGGRDNMLYEIMQSFLVMLHDPPPPTHTHTHTHMLYKVIKLLLVMLRDPMAVNK